MAINLIFASSWLIDIWELAKDEQFATEILMNLLKIGKIFGFASFFT